MPLVAKLLDILLPPLCMVCDATVTGHGTLCTHCWSSAQFIAPPFCSGCGVPFDTPVGDGELCAACLTSPPLYAAARAAMIYDDTSKRLILGFKHGDRTYIAKALAQWMQRAGHEFWPETDILIPVPLHRWRLYKRRYNQAAMLAQKLAKLTGKPVLVDALQRHRATPIQGHLNRKERQANVKNAFTLNPSYKNHLQDKSLILIDDVLTTGATLNECCRILAEANPKTIRVLTLARVKSHL